MQVNTLARWWRIDALGLGACALITAAGYFVLIRPTAENQLAYEALKPRVAERQQEVNEARSSAVDIQDVLEQTQSALNELPLRLERSSLVNHRVAQLAELASEMGLEVHQILPEPVRAGQRYDVVPIALSGAGDYGRVTRFMGSVHESFADIAVIEFSLASDNPGAQGAQFSIAFAWYTLPAVGMAEN